MDNQKRAGSREEYSFSNAAHDPALETSSSMGRDSYQVISIPGFCSFFLVSGLSYPEQRGGNISLQENRPAYRDLIASDGRSQGAFLKSGNCLLHIMPCLFK